MLFTPNEIQELLEIIEVNQIQFGAENIGKDILSTEEKLLLKDYGIDVDELPSKDYVEQAYKFGRLARAIGDKNAKDLSYNDFKKWIRAGGYIPLQSYEKETIKYLKTKTYSHLKNLGQRMGSVFETITQDQEAKIRANKEKIISKELTEGAQMRKSLNEIVSEIGHKTDDWQRDWGRIVETEMHNAYEEGRAAEIQRQTGEKDPNVYKETWIGVCRHCIKAYLTKGIGSKPRVFKLSELVANGTNIGKKVAQWKPVLGSMHPYSITDGKTAILTDKGWTPIKDIEVGDNVLTHKGRFKKVLSTLKDFPMPYKEKGQEYVYLIYYKHYSNKEPDEVVKISLTGGHKILTQRGWIEVRDLTANDKLIKLLKKCVICSNTLESYMRDSRSCCSEECSRKYRANNAHGQWNDYSEGELKELKFKISEKVKKNWEDGGFQNTLKYLKSESARKKTKERMLNGGALKALEGQGGKMTSKIQIKLYEMVLRMYPGAELEYKIFNKSLDIALPNYKIDIEFDGSNWHKDRRESDRLRDKLLKKNGWHVLRYEDKLPKIGILRNDIERIIQNHDEQYIFEETDILFIKRSYSKKGIKLYDIEVEDDESFIARGVVVHNCRCTLHHKPDHLVWDEEEGRWVWNKNIERKVERKSKIKITVGDKVFEV